MKDDRSRATKAEYDRLRVALTGESYKEFGERPLRSWLMKTDKYFPGALRDVSLKELLGHTFSSLAQTRGIGATKTRKLVALLARIERQGAHPAGDATDV